MAVVKLIDHDYSKPEDVYRLIDYVTGPLKQNRAGISGGRNLIGSPERDTDAIAEEFIIVQKDRNLRRRLYHVVVSFDTVLDKPNYGFLNTIGRRICSLYPEYQSLYTVHDDTDHLHLHIIFNNCSIYPNVKNLSSRFDFYTIIHLVDNMIDDELGIPMSARRIAAHIT